MYLENTHRNGLRLISLASDGIDLGFRMAFMVFVEELERITGRRGEWRNSANRLQYGD